MDGGACAEVQEGQGAHAYDPVRKEPRLTSRSLIQWVIRYMGPGRRHVDGLKRDTDTISPTKLWRLLRGIAGISTFGARARGQWAIRKPHYTCQQLCRKSEAAAGTG